jgi:hypothetical protein
MSLQVTAAIDVRCRWTLKAKRGVYACRDCGSWTMNLPLYRNSICPQKDRRKGQVDRRQP